MCSSVLNFGFTQVITLAFLLYLAVYLNLYNRVMSNKHIDILTVFFKKN